MASTDSITKNLPLKEETDELKVIKRRKLTNTEEVKMDYEDENKEESKDESSEELLKNGKEELSKNATEDPNSSQLLQKEKWGLKEEPLIKSMFVKSLVFQAEKNYKKRLDDGQMQWPYLPKHCHQLVQVGEKVFDKADKIDNLSERYLFYLRGTMILLRASHTLDEAKIGASVLYRKMIDRLKCVKECYYMATQITTKERVIYILGLWCLSVIYDKFSMISPNEASEDNKSQMELILLSHLAWSSANEESNSECEEFFMQVSKDVGYVLGQRSCIREFITFVDVSVKKLREIY